MASQVLRKCVPALGTCADQGRLMDLWWLQTKAGKCCRACLENCWQCLPSSKHGTWTGAQLISKVSRQDKTRQRHVIGKVSWRTVGEFGSSSGRCTKLLGTDKTTFQDWTTRICFGRKWKCAAHLRSTSLPQDHQTPASQKGIPTYMS